MSYEEQVSEMFRDFNHKVELAMLTGWLSGRWDARSACCDAPLYLKPGDYYAGVPACGSCNKTLGPDDLRYQWIPPRKLDENSTTDNPWPTEPTPAPGPLRTERQTP